MLGRSRKCEFLNIKACTQPTAVRTAPIIFRCNEPLPNKFRKPFHFINKICIEWKGAQNSTNGESYIFTKLVVIKTIRKRKDREMRSLKLNGGKNEVWKVIQIVHTTHRHTKLRKQIQEYDEVLRGVSHSQKFHSILRLCGNSICQFAIIHSYI